MGKCPMSEDSVVRFQKARVGTRYDDGPTATRAQRAGPTTPGRGRDRGHRELHRGELDPRLRQAVPGDSGPGLWQRPPVSRVQSAAAKPEAQEQATPASTRKGTAHAARSCQLNLVGR